MAGIAVAVAVVFGLLFAVRLVQGSPPAALSAEPNSGPRASAQALPGPGDRFHVARPGESLWSIAMTMAPDADPRPIVDALAEANGGTSIAVGQRIIIPAELVGAAAAAGTLDGPDALNTAKSGGPGAGSQPADGGSSGGEVTTAEPAPAG